LPGSGDGGAQLVEVLEHSVVRSLRVAMECAGCPGQLLVGILPAASHVLGEQRKRLADVLEELLDAGDPALNLAAGGGWRVSQTPGRV